MCLRSLLNLFATIEGRRFVLLESSFLASVTESACAGVSSHSKSAGAAGAALLLNLCTLLTTDTALAAESGGAERIEDSTTSCVTALVSQLSHNEAELRDADAAHTLLTALLRLVSQSQLALSLTISLEFSAEPYTHSALQKTKAIATQLKQKLGAQ